MQSQDRGRQGAAAADDREGGRAGREHGARHLRAAGLRLPAAQRDQSAADLRPGQGLRAGEPARQLSVLRHDRPGDGRHDGRERLSGRSSHPTGRDDRRYGHGHAVCHGHSRRPLSAHGDRPRPAHPDRHARRDAQLLPHADEPPGRSRRSDTARRQWRDRHGARRSLQMRAGRARRLVLHLLLEGQRGPLAPSGARDRPRGPAGRSAHDGRAHPRQEPGGRRRRDHGMDLEAHEAGGDGNRRRGGGAVRGRAQYAGAAARSGSACARHDADDRSSHARAGHRAGLAIAHVGHQGGAQDAHRSSAATARRSTASGSAARPPRSRTCGSAR